MLSDGFRYLEGSVNTNLTLPLTTSLPSVYTPNEGEVVYVTTGSNPGFYLYNGVRWISVLSTITNSTGYVILDTKTLPAFNGDVTSNEGENTLTLNQIIPALAGKTGTFNSVTINEKGLVVGGHNYTELSDMGITSSDPLLSSFITSSAKGAPDGLAGLDSNGKLFVNNFPEFVGGDVTSRGISGTTKLLLNKIYKPFTPTNPTDTDPLISIAGQYNLLTVNDKGLVTDGTKLELYTKSEIDALLGIAVFEVPDILVTIGTKVEPIDITNVLYALNNHPNILNSVRGTIVLFTGLGLSYIRKTVSANNPLTDWVELPQILNNINGAMVHKLLVSDIRLINTSPKLQLVIRTDWDKQFTLPAAKTLPLGGPIFVFKNMDPNNRYAVYSHNGKLLSYVDAVTDVSFYLHDNTDDDWTFIIQSSKDHEFIENKSTNINLVDPISLVPSDKLYPTQRAVKSYVTDTIKRDILDLKGRSELVVGATPPRLKIPGFATLDENNFLTLSQLPPEAVNKTYSIPDTFLDNHIYVNVSRANYLDAINNYATINHVKYQIGDIVILDIIKKVYILQSKTPNVWVELASGVLSINGNKVGDVHLDASDTETGVFDVARIPNINYLNDFFDNGYVTTDLVLTNKSAPIQSLKTLSTSVDVILPDATTMSSVGVRFVIRNTGLKTKPITDRLINIKSSNGTILYPLYPTQSVNILLVDTTVDLSTSWEVIGQATYHRFAELDSGAKLLTIQLPTFVGDVTSPGGTNTLTLKDAPFYNSSYVSNFYEYTKINRAGIAVDVKNKVFSISDISKLPPSTDPAFDPYAKYLIENSAFSYRWDGTRYVLDDDLLASHVYIINTIDAEKSDIILPNSPALLAKPNDIVFVRAIKCSFILTAPDATVLKNWVLLTYEGNYIHETAIANPLDTDILLDKDSPQFHLFKAPTQNGTNNWKYTLPVARTLSLGGMLFVFKNTGDPTDKDVDIISSSGVLVYTLKPGRFISLYLNSFNNNTGWEVAELTPGTELLQNKNQPFGYAGLDSDGLIPDAIMPLSYQLSRHHIETLFADKQVVRTDKTNIFLPRLPNLSVFLCDAGVYHLGNMTHIIENKGSYLLTVRDFTGGLIAHIKPRSTMNLLLIDQATPAGIWVALLGTQTTTNIKAFTETNLFVNSSNTKIVFQSATEVYLVYLDGIDNIIGQQITIVNGIPSIGAPVIINSVISNIFSITSLTPTYILIAYVNTPDYLHVSSVDLTTSVLALPAELYCNQSVIIDKLEAIDDKNAVLVYRTADKQSSIVFVDASMLPIYLWGKLDISSNLGSIDIAPISLNQIAVAFTINGLYRIGAFVLNRVTFGSTLSVCYDISTDAAYAMSLTTLATNSALCTYITQDRFVVVSVLKNTTYEAIGSHGIANVLTVDAKRTFTGAIAKKISVTALASDTVFCAILNEGNYITIFNLVIDDAGNIILMDQIERFVETNPDSIVDICAVNESSAILTFNNSTDGKLSAKYLTIN